MRLFQRTPSSNRFLSRRRFAPSLEILEDRTLLAADPVSVQFQSGLLTLHGNTGNDLVAVSLSSGGFVQLDVAGQSVSSNPGAADYDPALAGATAQTLQEIQLNGNAATDHLVVGNLTVAGGVSIESDGIVEVQGQVSAAGPIQLTGRGVLVSGAVRANGAIGGSITVTATGVVQSGVLEADGTQGAGGAIQVDYTGSYLATTASLTEANGTTAGGLVAIDGQTTGTLFTSGRYQASATHGQGGEIDLFGQQVHLVGANVSASGWIGGGLVRVGGDSPSDIAQHGGSTAGISFANTTTVDATTTLAANATGAGNGGHIVVWSQQSTTFGGTLSAAGAGAQGQGGLLEVSSAGVLTYGGHAAAAGAGHAGRLLLDPKNLVISDSAGFPQFNLLNPSPDPTLDTFGTSMVTLTNGNIVVTDPTSGDLGTSNLGAVYLYNGQTGALIGTLTGSTGGDQVGIGGVTALTNGNFVVSSPSWQDGNGVVGAATWINGTTGQTVDGATTIDVANSLIGSTDGDDVGSGSGLPGTTAVTALTNGNYVVISPDWQSNGNDVGAVTWSNGSAGTVGLVSATNSLVGSTAGDDVGSQGVTALTNGNYVVSSPSWQIDNYQCGAATWGNGLGGVVGPVSDANSLVGEVNQGNIAGLGVTALSNGNYVVVSPGWQDTNGNAIGAVTWGDGSTGAVGQVSATNSLTGATNFDEVGSGGVTALTNGDYVVSSPGWQDMNGDTVGAVTWAASDGSTIGPVTSGNSLVGSTANDDVGSGGVTALTNGDYVVSSPNWQNGIGAVTWGASDGSTVGTISASNSLTGSTPGDQVGLGNGNPGSGVIALSNGNYVVVSPDWQNNGNLVGAVTWAASNGTTVGAITPSNSLVGSTNNDTVGSGGVTALSNGSYVVSSPSWQDQGATIGAVTFGAANGSSVGAVTSGNSFVGATNGDDISSGGVVVLSNGDYVVVSPGWHSAGTQLGAATLFSGSTGHTVDGASSIDPVNSLVGPGSSFLLTTVVGLPGGSAYLASFTNHGGLVTEALVSASEAYATAEVETVNLSPSFLALTLDTGTAVVLQASDDITVSSPIVVNNPSGPGGSLTLQAGRSILLNASITTGNGNLTLIANDTAEDGVINGQRDPGTAVITMAAGTSISAGTGNVSFTLDTGDGNTNNASGNITLGAITANKLSVSNDGSGSITDSAALTVGSTTSVTTTGGPIQLTDSANAFSGTVTYTAPGGAVTLAATGNLTLASSSNTGSLTANTTGTLGESGGLTVLGAASLTGGTIALTNAANDLQGPVALTSSGALSLTDNAALTLGSLTLAGSTTLNAAAGITFTGALNVGANTLTLITNGSADLDGGTTLAGGTISDSHGLTLGAGGTLSGSGTLQAGSGGSGVLAQAGATIAPSVTGGGLTVNGDLSLALDSALSVQLQSGTQYSQLTVSGAVNLGNSTLEAAFENGYTPASTDRLQILTNGGTSAVSGTFAQGSSVTVSGTPLTISYTGGGNGKDVVLSLAPAAPVANVDVATMIENSPATTINVLAKDTGTGITITSVTQGANGSVAITGGGSTLTYQPNHLFSGVDYFTYTITDSLGRTATGTVVVDVTPLPVANTDYVTIPINSSATAINVLAIDTGTGITITSTGAASDGTVAITGSGTGLTYQPNHAFSGVDTFTYTIEDTAGNTATGTIVVNVTAPAAPVANSYTVTVKEDSTPNAINVLANDSGTGITITSVTQGMNGTVAITGNGAGLTYQPNQDFVGTDTFTYTITDTYGRTATGTVVVDVAAVNLPVANLDFATVAENGPATAINVLANDTGTGLSITSVTQGTNGVVVQTGNGTGLTYQPNQFFYGVDTFTYTIKDAFGNTATGTVVVDVTEVAQPPAVTVPGAMQFTVDESLAITGISAADPNLGNPNVTATLSVQNGTLTLGSTVDVSVQGNGTGTVVVSGPLNVVDFDLPTLTYLANRDSAAPDTLSVTVSDTPGGATTKTIALAPATDVITTVADPVLPGRVDLVIQGTAGPDTITVTAGKVANSFVVTLNSASPQTVTGVTGRILVFDTNASNNSITVNSAIKLPTVIDVGNGNNTVLGDGGNNTIIAGNGNNTLTGGAGNDSFTVGTGSNKIDGGTGTNTLIESGDVNFTLVGGTTKNGSLTKGSSTDTLVDNHIQQVELTLTGPDPRTIDGTAFSGPETLVASAGNDTLKAGSGADSLEAGSGNDLLVGGTGKDTLIGGSGSDTLQLGNGSNTVTGGSGTTTIIDGNGSNTIDGGSGTSTLEASGNFSFTLIGGTATKNGSLTKGTAKDTLILNHIQQAQLTLTGPGNDSINATAFSGPETLVATAGNDTLLAGSGSDSLQGGTGNDVLVGGTGNDVLVGGTGTNLLIAGGGADSLTAGNKGDLLIGGSTTYDSNLTALAAIMAEWTSTDTYANKIAYLLGTKTGGHNGTTHLTTTGTTPTVSNNHQASTLTGGSGLDWFWNSSQDENNAQNGETVTAIP